MEPMGLIPHFLVITGDGINCERETAQAFKLAKAKATIMHINDLLEDPKALSSYQGMAFPGGFSFGDELGSGQVLAMKMKHRLGDEFKKFVESKKAIIGICNGFQVLVKLGLLPDKSFQQSMALTFNEGGSFIDKWEKVKVESKLCAWTHLLQGEIFGLPIRHGEGRVAFDKEIEKNAISSLKAKDQIVLRYQENPNGSANNIAGICDESGLVFGLMPHPEAALYDFHRDDNVVGKTMTPSYGAKIFDSIVTYLQEH